MYDNHTDVDPDRIYEQEYEKRMAREMGRRAAEAARDDMMDHHVEMLTEELEEAVPLAIVTVIFDGERARLAKPYDRFEERDFDRLRDAGWIVADVADAHKITVKRA